MKYDSDSKTVTGCWLRLTQRGMEFLAAENGWVEATDITPRQVSAWMKNDTGFEGDDWRDVYGDDDGDQTFVRYWRRLMIDWNLDPKRVYECFDAEIPVTWFGGAKNFREGEYARRVSNARADMCNPSLRMEGASRIRKAVFADMHGVDAEDL